MVRWKGSLGGWGGSGLSTKGEQEHPACQFEACKTEEHQFSILARVKHHSAMAFAWQLYQVFLI
jgi:hypothetical protein